MIDYVTQVVIIGSFLGIDKHVLYDIETDAMSLISVVPDDVWVFDVAHDNSDGPDPWSGRSINMLARLNHIEVPSFPHESYVKAYASLGHSDKVPWWNCMPRAKWHQMLCEVTRSLVGVLNASDIGYHRQVFEPSRRLLWSLERCVLDVDKLNARCLVDSTNNTLESMVPHDGTTSMPKVMYDPFGGRTGRLKVLSGPKIMHVKRTDRDVITSRWSDEGGKVIEFDYRSLEARIALIGAGYEPKDDVYTMIKHELNLPRSLSRDDIKTCVISVMYGASAASTSISQEVLDDIRAFFDVDAATRRVREKIVTTTSGVHCIVNKYGRMIPVPDPLDDHIIFNSYIQSTGVDVALLGFSSMYDMMVDLKLVSCPVFVLHDAFFVDFIADELQYIDALKSVGSHIVGYDVPFAIATKEVG